jgi:hypothetical protein
MNDIEYNNILDTTEVNREIIYLGYILLLGREPEDEEIGEHISKNKSVTNFRNTILQTEEFNTRYIKIITRSDEFISEGPEIVNASIDEALNAIIWSYKIVLGRNPENRSVVELHAKNLLESGLSYIKQGVNSISCGEFKISFISISLFSDLIVLNGPFKGLVYPQYESVGSVIAPKLLGSYEMELHPIIDEVIKKNYDSVVDIGCAEGYYAIGLGKMMPNTSIFAFDTFDKARILCERMAELNGVNVDIGAFCTKDTLMNLKLGTKSLIISDCEGYELQLFDDKTVTRLKNHDFLIEVHDPLNKYDTTKKMLSAFSRHHNLTVIQSIDDVTKPYLYDFSELENLSFEERRGILAEGRMQIMKWIFATSKN